MIGQRPAAVNVESFHKEKGKKSECNFFSFEFSPSMLEPLADPPKRENGKKNSPCEIVA